MMLLWVGILKRRWNNVFKCRTKSENNNQQKGRKWKIFEMAGWTTAVAIAKLNCALAVLKRDAQCIGWSPFLCYLPEDTFEYVKPPCWEKTLTVDMWSVWLHKLPDVPCFAMRRAAVSPLPPSDCFHITVDIILFQMKTLEYMTEASQVSYIAGDSQTDALVLSCQRKQPDQYWSIDLVWLLENV